MGLPQPQRLGRYELVLALGKGGMAELYLGRLHGAGGFARTVAIKRILPHLADDRVFVDMFLNEGRIAAQLAHPNVCQVIELGEDAGELYLAMEYLEGVSWDALARAVPSGPAKLQLAAGVLAQACEGLHYAHGLGIVHRDVSPQNLFVTTHGIAKVLDFGVSKMAKEGPRTRTGVLKGKLPYMAPEQIRGEPLDARCDVFALGVVLWEALAGEPLFDRDTDFLIWKAIEESEIPRLAPRGYPPAIDAVLARALERDRARRYPDARAMAADLVEVTRQAGGALDAPSIAHVLRAACGDELARRSAAVAAACELVAPGPSDTIREPVADAGSTVSLRAEVVPLARPDAMPTAMSTAGAPARPMPTAVPKSRWWLFVAIAVLAAAAATVVTILLVRREGESSRVATPAPSRGLELAGENGSISLGANGLTLKAADGRTLTIDRGMMGARGATGTQGPTGSFSIDADPQATVFVDDKELGKTPISGAQIAIGHHRVRLVESSGERAKEVPIDIAAGQELDSGTVRFEDE